MRDVNYGWLIRYLHSNTASAFFFLVYLHIGKGIYYGSYRYPRSLVWLIGTIIFILMMATAFLGYQHSPKWLNKSNKELQFNKSTSRLLLIRGNKANKFNKWPVQLCHLPPIYIYGGGVYRGPGIIKRGFCTSTLWGVALRAPKGGGAPHPLGGRVSDKLEIILKELNLNPVYIYENLNLEETRKQILNETRGLSGIYMIVNKLTKDYYIGSASTNRFYSRFSNHVIYFRGSKIVKLAIKKYDIKNFAFIILDLYPNIVTRENNKELLDLEDKYLKLLLPNYNILTEAGSSFGYKHTEIDRQKMKDMFSDIRREFIRNLNKGKKFSAETIQKMREKALNRLPMSDETKKKCIVNTKPVILYNLNKTIYGKYPTIKEAAFAINCSEKTIIRAFKTEKRLVKKQWIVEEDR